MKTLIKKIIKEEISKSRLYELLSKYRFKNDVLDRYYIKKFETGQELSQNELDNVEWQLISIGVLHKLKKDISTFINKNTGLQESVKENGIIAFNNLIKGNKKDILNFIFLDKVFQIGKPSNKWFEKNIEDITKLRGVFPILEDKTEYSLQRCKNKNYMGIIKKDGELFVWSILNKINTNYVNWGRLISEKVNGRLIKITIDLPSEYAEAEEIIKEYFTIQRSISDFNFDAELISIITKLKIRSLSFAESDIIEAFYLYVNKKATEKLDGIFSTIESTTSQGDSVERIFMNYLEIYSDVVEDVYSFSSPGNLVDMELGIDLMAKIDGKYYAIQVKSCYDHALKAKIKRLPVDYMVVYPTDNDLPSQEKFSYITKDKSGANFNEFINDILSKKQTKSVKSTPKPPPSIDYLRWAGYDE